MQMHESYTQDALPIISDIHGNLSGLKAVLAFLKERGIERPPLYLGDYIWTQHADVQIPDLIEILEIIGSTPSTAIIQGNTDEYFLSDWIEDWQPDSSDFQLIRERMLAVKAALGEQHIKLLASMLTNYKFRIGEVDCLACHASPADNSKGLTLDMTTKELSGLISSSEAQCLVTGHLHRAFTRHIINGPLQISVGAVGRHPHEWDGILDFAILDSTSSGLVCVHHRITPSEQLEEGRK